MAIDPAGDNDNMQLVRPGNLSEALKRLAADPEYAPIAGGTDLMVSWPHYDHERAKLLDLSLLDGELRSMHLADDWLELGALTTYWDILSAAGVCEAFPLLPAAARQVGAIQIQTRGTWAGNIANGSPAADGVPVLMAYDAQVVLASTRGRREVALDGYYTGYKRTVRRPDELIVAIRVPRRPRELEWFHKVGARSAQAITKVGVAIVKDARGWRVVANSVAPFVCRCRTLERELDDGRCFGNVGELRKVLAADISPIDDIRSTAAYRAEVLARLISQRLGAFFAD